MSHILSSPGHYNGGDGDHTPGASSSSTPRPSTPPEVFLSFRGETRRQFTDHLYNKLDNEGISVFRDKEGLTVGERNWPELLKAIEASKISILIISPDYDSSEWCLNELVHILKCKKTYGQVVIPIFYHVKPSDLRKKFDGSEEESQVSNKRGYDYEGRHVQEWKDALEEVSYMTGLESEKIADGYEAELVKIVVAKVLKALKKHTLDVSDDLVGVGYHAEVIMNMVNVEGSSDVRAILIHGTGGIGKTTLAKVVYNQLSYHFDCCSFLANVRETSSRFMGKEGLQKQLISDILGQKESISSVDDGVKIIRDRFKCKKVLILLDDVDHRDQMNALARKWDWFGGGSILIITSRINDILKEWEGSFSYELNGLNNDDSFQLFCKHAFKRCHSIPNEFYTIAKEIVSTTGGLPLAIEVIGCLLHGEVQDIWKEKLKKLKEIPDDEVQSKLKISFDALNHGEQQIFLDIACFPDLNCEGYAIHMWDSCGFYPELGINKLISMSLIKTGDGKELIIHDQLRDLGREIVRRENRDNPGDGKELIIHDQLRDLGREIVRRENRVNPGKHSRLWKTEEAFEVLESEQGTQEVQILDLTNYYDKRMCTSKQFEGMGGLRHLRMWGTDLEGGFTNLFQSLRWLKWSQGGLDSMGSNFIPKNLVVLELFDVSITEEWMGWNQMKRLKVLKLKHCSQLTTTPDFSAFQELEVLILQACSKLRKIHPSIGKLSKSLKVLDVSECDCLEELPIEVGKMEELSELILDSTAIREIPIEIGFMAKLETLSANNCSKLEHIPDSVGSLVKLQRLMLSGCTSLRKIPKSIEELKLLTELDLVYPVATQLPNSIGDLYNLERFESTINYLSSSVQKPYDLQTQDISLRFAFETLVDEKWQHMNKNKGKEAIQSTHPSNDNPAAAKEYTFDVFLSGNKYSSLYRELSNKFKNAGLHIAVGETDSRASDGSVFSRMEAIEQSKLCIPIFSPYYDSLKIYLDQVAKINECRKTTGQIVLPIFYNIEPSDAQNQTGPFKLSFLDFQLGAVDLEVINKWKEALREIGSLKGYTIAEYYISHPKYVNEIFSQVIELLFYEDNLVGIEQSYRSVAKMLQIGNDRDVRIVGICGMPGMGKTTLAQAVYNNIQRFFNGCSFVSSIQERSREKGLHDLQVQLINDLLRNTDDVVFRSFENNLQFIKDRFSNTRVLIVLDGVECPDHIKAFGVDLKCFGPGSRIILTTRKPELLVEAGVPSRYFVEELDEPCALKLFYKHVFKNEFPTEDYDHLSTQIASSTRGIPLVIESVGSYLSHYRNKEKERWEEVLQQLRSCQYKPLQELLTLSHDYLSKGRWHFYHDKTCFPMGESNDIIPYDVVLSFDARDKVKNLVESLHKKMQSFGIGIFALNGDSMHVNVTGKILIPVFSKSYASNSSCLEMLVHMIECKRSSATNHILPIFCAVEPSNIRLQTPFYSSEDDEVTNRWKDALTEVANISGSSLLETCMMEKNVNLTESICQMVLHKLKLNQLSMGNHLVGINHHLERILELLNLEVNDVRILAISGTHGTGKTTLAKILYHQLSSSFEGCSFLVEIDERTREDDGIKYLQANMISDLLNRKYEVFQSVIEEIDVIERRFQHMKVLIILDDVTNSSHVKALVGQLGWFGFGSRIIITTQHPAIIPLPHLNYQIMTNCRRDYDDAYKLLNKHAFRKDEPLPNFKSLSQELVRLLYGVAYPLVAIEVVGSLLYGKGVAEWESLSRKPGFNAVEQILKICYDRLDSTQQKVFLDISCLPNGIDRRIASYLWCDSSHSSDLNGMETLIRLMLVKVDAGNRIWMHRIVRDFGRDIVRGENKGVSQQTLHSKCLKVLDMSWSKIGESCKSWKQLKMPQLRVLNLSGCSNLMVTPVFSFCPDLEMLILEHCPRLVKIDPSIGGLQHLNTLKLRYCCELSVLPKEVGRLTALTELLLDGTSLRELPVSIGHLKNLRLFTAINCFSLSYLPSATLNLSSLTVVKLDYANITELPRTIGQNMKLQHLSLRGCHGITRLPSLVGEVESSLIELDVSKTSISELPKSIANLKALRVLKMECCFIMEFPPHFGELRRLEEIHASRCRGLANVPDDVGELESLRILDISESCISSLPQSILALAHLETLNCTSCNKLQSLPELPSSLTSVHVESKELNKLPDLVNLKQLKELTLGSDEIVNLRALSNVSTAAAPENEEDDSFDWLPQSSLRTLQLSLPLVENLPAGIPYSLRKLSLHHCTKLKHIPPLPSTLVVLSIQDCRSLWEMPSLENLVNLQEMEMLDCPEIKKIEGLENLQSLRVLTMSSGGIVSLKERENLKLKGVTVNIGS